MSAPRFGIRPRWQLLWASLFLIAALATVLLVAATGCQHFIVDGGSSEHASRGYTATIDPQTGAVTVSDTRDRVATTQPHSDGFGATPNIHGTDAPGDIGGIGFTQLKAPNIGNIVLGSICLIAAALAYYFTRNLIVTGVCLAIGVAAFVLPTVLGIVAVGVLVMIVLLHNGTTLKRIIASVSFGLKSVPDVVREDVKARMEQKQSPADVAAIKALRPNL